MSGKEQRSRRRRVVRHSDAEHIDRTMDSPHHEFGEAESRDGERHVELDGEPDAEDAAEQSAEEFLAEQRPPHHGG
ncbi:hypothetical protein [Corynebacterium guangdongense]|uniref:YfhD family protein n=1 Tax=Corynebacterium guangdongense TaxID=1783348 RepID=A0ABU1ZV88_9CORY|nr:hypothetical protein [Corynebacterium guangdongense]MDR7328836.1 hypothetical protein [Corynebacterium guangdongense]WJZ17411.1 hypothetical protein CGUA_04100 [Corynebacterium guangdongense]